LRRDVRRALLVRFPFGVYYAVVDPQIHDPRIDIIAVMNLRQHPDTWRLPDRQRELAGGKRRKLEPDRVNILPEPNIEIATLADAKLLEDLIERIGAGALRR
jgi:hypothetical protein